MKPGMRLKSAVCDTEVMVIRAGEGQVECGGQPMAEAKQDIGVPEEPHTQGSLLGKRYVNAADTLELLCVKPGAGSLSLGGEPLAPKGAKPLPASD